MLQRRHGRPDPERGRTPRQRLSPPPSATQPGGVQSHRHRRQPAAVRGIRFSDDVRRSQHGPRSQLGGRVHGVGHLRLSDHAAYERLGHRLGWNRPLLPSRRFADRPREEHGLLGLQFDDQRGVTRRRHPQVEHLHAASTARSCSEAACSHVLQVSTVGSKRWGDYLDASRDPDAVGIWSGANGSPPKTGGEPRSA